MVSGSLDFLNELHDMLPDFVARARTLNLAITKRHQIGKTLTEEVSDFFWVLSRNIDTHSRIESKTMEIKEVVKEKYGQAAVRVQSGESSSIERPPKHPLSVNRATRSDRLRPTVGMTIRLASSAWTKPSSTMLTSAAYMASSSAR